MKFGTIGFIKIYCYHDLSSSGFTIKPKVYGPSLRSAVYRRPTSMSMFVGTSADWDDRRKTGETTGLMNECFEPVMVLSLVKIPFRAVKY